MPVSKDFQKKMQASKAAQKRFKAAKKARPTSNAKPDIPNGNYICRIAVEAGNTERDQTPFVSFKWTVIEGEYSKVSWRQTYYLEGEDDERTQREWDNLSRTIQVLGDFDDEAMEEFEDWDMANLIEVLENIDEAQPICKVGVKNWKGEKSEGLNAYFNELLDEADIEETQAVEEEEEPKKPARKAKSAKKKVEEEPEEEESEEEEEDEEEEVVAPKRTRRKTPPKVEEEEEEDEEPEDEEEEEEEVEIKKGDYVYYKAPKKKMAVECKVTSCNKTKRICNLVEEDNPANKYTAVDWSAVELVEYED